MDLWEMRRIAGGRVMLHDARRDERRTVDLETFEIGVFTVTQEQFAEVLGIPAPHPRRPAADLSWLRAIRFCNAASEWEGLDPAYSFDGEDVRWQVDSDGYRLPTEAEWEFACRAGSTAAQYGPLDEIAWTAADRLDAPRDVGGRLPNLNGLFDTLGNVWEWCWDLLDPARYDDYRVFRGGFADEACAPRCGAVALRGCITRTSACDWRAAPSRARMRRRAGRHGTTRSAAAAAVRVPWGGPGADERSFSSGGVALSRAPCGSGCVCARSR